MTEIKSECKHGNHVDTLHLEVDGKRYASKVCVYCKGFFEGMNKIAKLSDCGFLLDKKQTSSENS